MELLIISGMSGSGKSKCVASVEDMGYYCVDNAPVELLPSLVSLCLKSENTPRRMAFVADARANSDFEALFSVLDEVKERGIDVKILYLDASKETLIKRYKETRRRHPLESRLDTSLESAIETEKQILKPVKAKADYVIDTSELLPNDLRHQLESLLFSGERRIKLQFVAFGYKYGLPSDADLVFDVRCLPNPFYIEELKPLDGRDSRVYDYVFSFPQSVEMAQKITDLLAFSIPFYKEEGKTSLVIAVGCTGGKHRSVSVARRVGDALSEKGLGDVSLSLRDAHK